MNKIKMSIFDTVWLIDDCEATLLLNRKVLLSSRLAKKIVTFNNAGDALFLLSTPNLANGDLPTVAFVDLNMPLMNGLRFLEEFERLNYSKEHQIRIFVLSSSLDQGDIKKAKNYGCVTGYISKPLTLSILASLVGAPSDEKVS